MCNSNLIKIHSENLLHQQINFDSVKFCRLQQNVFKGLMSSNIKYVYQNLAYVDLIKANC